MLYELILINEIEQRAKIIFLSVDRHRAVLNLNFMLNNNSDTINTVFLFIYTTIQTIFLLKYVFEMFCYFHF